MNLLATIASAETVHDLTTKTDAAWAYTTIVGVLLSIIGWFLIRDRGSIKETLDRLVDVVEALRLDLAANYAKKIDLERLDRKIEKLVEHMTVREHIYDRRGVEDAETK